MAENVEPKMQGSSNMSLVQDLPSKAVLGNNSFSRIRSPLKDIANSPSETNITQKNTKISTNPLGFDAIKQLDEEEGWRDRAEVVTHLDHVAYQTFAKEVIEEVVNKAVTFRRTDDGLNKPLDRDSTKDQGVTEPTHGGSDDAQKKKCLHKEINPETNNSAPEDTNNLSDGLLIQETSQTNVPGIESLTDDLADEVINSTNPSSSEVENKHSTTQQEILIPEEPEQDENNTTMQEEFFDSVEDVKEMPVPSKGYNLDFLEVLDENNIDPFKTKCSVMNSPDRKETENDIQNETVIKAVVKTDTIKTTEVVVVNPSEKEKMLVKDDVEIMKKTPQKEIKQKAEDSTSEDTKDDVPAAKDYNLDILSKLDDSDFDPFKTKTTVSNTPDQKDKVEVKSDADKTMLQERDSMKGEGLSPLPKPKVVLQLPTEAILSPKPSLMLKLDDTFTTNEAEKSFGLSLQEGLHKDDSGVGSWTERTITNDAGDSTCPPRSEMEVCKYSITQPEDIASKILVQDVNKEKTVDTKEEFFDSMEDVEERPVPSKGYNLNFLEALDENNIDPFKTKCSVMNSPDRKETENDIGNETVIEAVVKTDTIKTTEVVVVNPSEKEETVVKDDVEIMKKTPQKEIKQKAEDSTPEDTKDDIPAAKDYNLDILSKLDDPDYDPFKTKTTVTNTPDRKGTENDIGNETVIEAVVKTNSSHLVVQEPECTNKIESDTIKTTEVVVNPGEKEEKLVKDDVEIMKKTPQKEIKQKAEDSTSEDTKDGVPAAKDYNLDILSKLDDSDFDPFKTKTTVSNTPDQKDKVEVKSDADKTMLQERDSMKGEGLSPLPKPKVVLQLPTEAILSPKPSLMLKLDDTFTTNEAEKSFGLLLQEGLHKDDSGVGSWTERTITNDAGDSTCPPRSEMEVCKYSITQPEDIASKILVQDVNKEKTVDTKEEFFDSMEDVEERPVPSKGYNLNFLEALDENNIDPFKTKCSVMNSPDRKETENDIGNETVIEAVVKTDTIKTTEVVVVNPSEKEETVVKDDVEIMKKTPQKEIKQKAEDSTPEDTKDDIPAAKDYNLDILSKLDDPNFDPFKTKTTVSNSPDRKGTENDIGNETVIEAVVKTNSSHLVVQEPECTNNIESDTIKTTEVVVNVSDEKETLVKNDTETLNTDMKKTPQNEIKQKAEDSTPEDTKDEVPAAKGYSLDFLSKLDDPFKITSTVANSPDHKDKARENSEVHKTVFKDGDSLNGIDSLADRTLTEVDSATPPESKGVKQHLAKQHGDLPSEEPVQVVREQKTSDALESISVSSKGYNFDHLDEMDIDPFKTKPTVMNSPNKKEYYDKSDKKKSADIPSAQSQVGEQEQCLEIYKEPNKIKTEEDSAGISNDKTTQSVRGNEKLETCEENNVEIMDPPQADVFSPFSKPKACGLVVHDVFSPISMTSRGQPEDDEFKTASEFFSNIEDIEFLSQHGTEGDKVNLARNSLYVRFDPLVGGRPSMAPYIAQQVMRRVRDEDGPTGKEGGLMSFSPSPKKRMAPDQTTNETTCNLFASLLEDTVFYGDHNDTSIASGNNTTVIQQPIIGEKMVPEKEMISELKKMELIMQDKLLRKSREYEEILNPLQLELQENYVVRESLEEDNASLRLNIQQMQDIVVKIKNSYDNVVKKNKAELEVQETIYSDQLKSEEEKHKVVCQQYTDDIEKMEGSFIDQIKKYERLREVSEILKKNNGDLKIAVQDLNTQLTQKEESFKSVINILEENYAKGQQEYESQKEHYENELKKAQLMIRRSEIEMISLKETVEKKTQENMRLHNLLDEMSKY
ncbi:hypothetical protein Pmani_005961 [Petrolisthes manimaculis]|uniref:Transforming acidic coiled-coil-containing protein C-terminal domain-containing protein n=1 Tax=Petrolisthes manimaculis TaxID=1843537 RepID=A0AAE1QBC4_9EUCA|nr:hypothetical protein Pmani_005961 [Petrolisthes manimaculis]